MPQMCGTRPPIPASHLHELTGNTLAKLRIYFYFSKQRGEKVEKRKNFRISTSLTHLGALKAHEYWDEASDLCLVTPHLEVTFGHTKVNV